MDEFRSSKDRLSRIAQFLSTPLVSSLFGLHPNDLGTSGFVPPKEWSNWWGWADEQFHDQDASSTSEPWLDILGYYSENYAWKEVALGRSLDVSSSPLSPFKLPDTLLNLVEEACLLAVPRDSVTQIHPRVLRQSRFSAIKGGGDVFDASSGSALPGMSPKKAHEVLRMSNLIGKVLQSGSSLGHVNHVADVGAGQAYLSRMLRDTLGLHVLALDSSDVQTQGAAKRDAPKSKRGLRPVGPERVPFGHDSTGHTTTEPLEKFNGTRGSLTYVTTKIDADTLLQSTRSWIQSEKSATTAQAPEATGGQGPTPVLFVALHACGSLTPDIFRAFAASRRAQFSGGDWTPQGAVVVGCCYNMLRPGDFPLSRALRTSGASSITLTSNHLQLAAQVPAQWARTEETLRDAKLALRKVVWRALIQDVLDAERRSPSRDDPTSSFPDQSMDGLDTMTASAVPEGRGSKRLGRLSDAAYTDWATFAQRVQEKLGLPDSRTPSRGDSALERRIAVFHVLRCIVGPVIESLILLDRAAWMEEELEGTGLRVELINLFDQASGSGRNIAIVIRPRDHDNENSSV
ncbi:methyltransferase domain-containing protein [Trametes meyenii]|nr:methyltransferase domain-containing protein [Trametes meyenii]